MTADGTANGDSAADAFMRSILDGAAQYERALIRSRTKAALAAKSAKGERVDTIPFGFDVAAELALCGFLSRRGRVFGGAQVLAMMRTSAQEVDDDAYRVPKRC